VEIRKMVHNDSVQTRTSWSGSKDDWFDFHDFAVI